MVIDSLFHVNFVIIIRLKVKRLELIKLVLFSLQESLIKISNIHHANLRKSRLDWMIVYNNRISVSLYSLCKKLQPIVGIWWLMNEWIGTLLNEVKNEMCLSLVNDVCQYWEPSKNKVLLLCFVVQDLDYAFPLTTWQFTKRQFAIRYITKLN